MDAADEDADDADAEEQPGGDGEMGAHAVPLWSRFVNSCVGAMLSGFDSLLCRRLIDPAVSDF